MKKLVKNALLFSSLFLVACGGGDVSSSPTTSNSEGSVSSENVSIGTSSEETVSFHDDYALGERDFRVRTIKEDGTPYYNEDLKVQWCSESGNCYPLVNIDKNGYARITIPEDNSPTYSVHLMGLDEAYAYNINKHFTDPSNRDIEITIYEVAESSVIQCAYGEEEHFIDVNVVDLGVYRATVTEETPYYLAFEPKEAGKYKIEAWAYDIMGVKTKLNYLGGSIHYIQGPIETYEDGGLNGNAAHTINCSSSYVGASYVYSFVVEGDYLFYPFSFEYEVAYVGEADEPIVEEPKEVVDVHATETLTVFADQPRTLILTPTPLDGSVSYFYNETDRFYHLESVDGPLVCVAINTASNYLPGKLSEIHTQQYGDPDYFILDDGTKNYAPLISEYSAVCNKQGVYPATQELRECIELIIEKNDYFKEHETLGGFIYTQLGYVPAAENQWLYSTYYYRSLV